MGNCCCSSATEPTDVPSVQVPSPGPQPTRTLTPTSPKPDTAESARSLGAGSSQQGQNDSRDYLLAPPSSGGDVFTLQYPDHTVIHSPPYDTYLSSRTGSTWQAKSVSMDETDLRSTHSPRSMRRSATTGLGIPSISGHGLSSATNKSPARSPSRRRFPLALQNLLPNDFRYGVRL